MPPDGSRGTGPRGRRSGAAPRARSPKSPQTRRSAPAIEAIEIRAADGWSLRADVYEPAQAPRGVAVLAHAMMARRTEFDRPRAPETGERGAEQGLVHFLAERGWRVVAFDFRGHGDSGPRAHEGGRYRYDDFVERDLPAVFAFARSRAPRKRPVVLVGHSLGGHTGLAAQGAGLVSFDGIVAVAANIWLRDLEPSPRRWLAKRAVLAGALAICRRVGRFPARALRLGSDDEARGYVEDLARFTRTGAWTNADGRIDYLASLSAVRVPVLQILSDGDRLSCAPECGARFVARCGARHDLVRLTHDRDGPPPDHMGLVTSFRSRSAWARAEEWMRAIVVSRWA
jgi:predicted alpha/beta hydrolase